MGKTDLDGMERSDALQLVLPPLFDALATFKQVQRMFHPAHADKLAEALAPRRAHLDECLGHFERKVARGFKADLRPVADAITASAEMIIDSMSRFETAAKGTQEFMALHRALRGYNHAIAALYPLCPLLAPVSAFFLEPSLSNANEFIDELKDGLVEGIRNEELRGVMHADNDGEMRAGYSLYVPENYAASRPAPLVVALHGGSGHGKEFLWNWLPEARSRGCIVISPTSKDRTWSIIEPADVDKARLLATIADVRERFCIDPARILLTGMSDGATYTLMLGLQSDTPFTHLAPVCGVLHPAIVLGGGLAHAHDKPIYLLNGELDWMFPIAHAHSARDQLRDASAKLVFRSVPDLGHTYPRDENPGILEWFGAPLPKHGVGS